MAAPQYEEELFEQTGQYEPLTTRLRNILQEYKDGVGIFKELIQNADDAGATTVKFLVDWRNGQTGSLFSSGMAECQGPALWAYNNAVFTDEDFENINKLAGETKVEDVSKIGRFGLGFNAVYHLTDVPSFISREHLVVFDPNIHHLQHHIRDRSRPGIHINFTTKPDSLTRYHDQFQPYNGIFGCNTAQGRGTFYFNGTLFRFPFRTASQARTSYICTTAYRRDKVEAIVGSLCECASHLLIFSQHVKMVEVYELNGLSQPDEMQLVLSVNKPSIQPFRRKVVNNEEPFIKQCSKWWEQYRESQMPSQMKDYEFPSGCELVNIVTTKKPSELSRCDREYSSDQMWFVVSASGTDASLKIARSPEGRARGFLPCGGAAFVIQKACGKSSEESRVSSNVSGELFCFLPLSISTGLPVHVNGYFAIMSNRVEIWKRTNVRIQPIEVNWNEALMEDALARAYITLLENMKEWIDIVQDYKFHTLWPSNDVVDMKSWEKLVQKICFVLLDSKSKLFYSDGKWMSIADGFLLSDDFNEIYETAVEVLRSQGIHVFNLPKNILQTLVKFDRYNVLQRRTLSFTEFVKQYFFPKMKTFTPSQRDAIVCFGLDRILKGSQSSLISCTKESSMFQQNACISVSEDGGILAKPGELIHPLGPAAELFSEDDYRFPVGHGLRDANRLYALETLGMVKDLDWTGIYERARSIAQSGFLAKMERPRKLIDYLNKRIDQLPKPGHYCRLLQQETFLPVLDKPVGEYFLPWKGSSGLPSTRFCAPKDIFLGKDAKLIGSSCRIANTSERSGCGEMNAKVKDLLGFFNRRPADKLVIQQLDEAIKFWRKLTEEEKQGARKTFVESVCQKIYEFFNDRIKEKAINRSFLNELGKRDWLFLEGNFLQSNKVAFTSNGNGAPYLFTLPASYRGDYYDLFDAMEIKETFDSEDYINALYELESTKQGYTLTEDELEVAAFFISQIDAEDTVVEDYIGQIPLPDTDSILRRSEDVVVNLSLWLTDPDDNVKVHEKIPPQTAHALGAKSLKNSILKKHSRRIDYGEAFGQHEELTDRLSGILRGYPSDGILKELVQNADDAQASEIHFIHDTRSLKCEKVAIKDETCEEIQGPALCVYNDRPFTDKDLEGIKKLGIGSKRESIETTGRYGIGFNSVYHLTDCPSFLSNDDTLVILDPHRRYVLDEDPGKLFKLTTKLRNDFSDTLNGYLSDYFTLQGSTMFRFPLRQKLNISKIDPGSLPDMNDLLKTFQAEAQKSLLFLNHVKKITLSKIHPNGKFEEIYQVETVITSEDEKKRQRLARKIWQLNSTPTAEIVWDEVSYTLKILEKKKEVEKWLVQKCIGFRDTAKKHSKIPDGRELGFFPHGGVAARLWTHSKKKRALRGIVYCFLPLPEDYTKLPVHVNGHFALDNNRRGLWTDTDGKSERSKWNDFVKTCVLAPAYAALIQEARNYLCNDEDDNRMSRYHALFPSVNNPPWKTLTTGLYRYLGQTRANVLPLLVPTKSKNEATASFSHEHTKISVSSLAGPVTDCIEEADSSKPQHVKVTCTEWLEAEQAYFKVFHERDVFLHLLIRIGLPVLLHAPRRIYSGFKSADMSSHEVNSKNVISFLRGFERRNSTCKIGQLPKKLENTAINSIPELSALIEYCRGMDNFSQNLEGLPLLLTQDGYLRVFESRQPVFRSEFGDLFPTQLNLFVHFEIIYKIPLNATTSEENIVREFTVRDFAGLLPLVFTDQVLRAIKDDDTTWKFPDEGILSEQWFKNCWDFLQNHAKPEPEEDFVSLECLSEWPVIPTKCGKLVTIRDAKYVLNMTSIGNESGEQLDVREFLIILNCPVLNNDITFNDESVSEDDITTQTSSKKNLERKIAVTDPYVAHPHNAAQVLTVLHHMLKMSKLNLSGINEKRIRKFLKFVESNYERSRMVVQCRQMVKDLPFHKTLDGQFVSLILQSSSYVLVPFGVPTEQLDELQKRSKCCFLSSDALPALKKLYKDLGVRAGQDVIQFYVKYVFKHFSMFTRESQIKHLIYIRDEVYPFRPEANILRTRMSEMPCIPDKNGDLYFAWELVDPNNEMFKMFEDDCNIFPPSPFDGKCWFKLLRAIGLQVDISPQLFLLFCTAVARVGKEDSSNQQNRKRSEGLVKCLFSKEILQEEKFLSKVSRIKFIAPAKVEEELTSIHKQHQCPENGKPPYFEFRDAVPWHYRNITWTNAHILPEWAQRNNMAELKNLRIACSGPTYTNVLHHLKNLAKSYNPDSVDSNVLHKITKAIYHFLLKATKCCSRNPNDECSDVCIDIGIRLKSLSCIFLQEDKVFVKAEQLVFKLPENSPLKPFLYRVPMEFGDLEHFLKRLGATQKPTPLQIAYILNSKHNEVGEELLSTEDGKKIKYAMRVLFKLLCKGKSADGIDELYLPNQNKQLVNSCKMVCKVPLCFLEIIEKLQRPILLSFKECGLKKIDDDYIDVLPEHLRPAKFDEIVQEEVDHECKNSICPKAQHGFICEFQQKFQNLLRSDEFQEGLKRLLIHHRQDPQEFEQRIKKLQTDVQTKCIGDDSVKIKVMDREAEVVLRYSTESCYATESQETWILYMQHDFKDDKRLVSTATCVNKILGNCIQNQAGLIVMLDCDSPSEISKKLDKLNISLTFELTDDFTNLDDESSEWDSDDEPVEEGHVGSGWTGKNNGGKNNGTSQFKGGGGSYDGGHRAGSGRRPPRIRDDDEDWSEEGIFHSQDHKEARRWVQQSKYDLKTAKWLLESGPTFSSHACFQSHQVVEKCLKAMLYYSCGISGGLLGRHKVDELAHKLIEETGLPIGAELTAVKRVAKYYLPTRYPNCHPPYVVPAKAFSVDEAKEAVDAASKVLEFADQYCSKE